MTTIDAFLDLVKTVLITAQTGVPELFSDNVCVWHAGSTDPAEDIAAAANKCQGVSVLVYDLGGTADPDDAAHPVLLCQTAVELYVDVTKRNRKKTPALRLPGSIRDDIMHILHDNPLLLDGSHCHLEPRIKSYKPVEDPSYVCFRIILQRTFYLG